MSRDIDPARHEALLRYLLDQSTEEERAQIEEALLADRSLQEDLSVAEEELADRYATRRMGQAESKTMEQNFLGAQEWRARIRTARAINVVAAEWAGRPMMTRPLFSTGLIAAATSVAIACAWMIFHTAGTGRRPPELAEGPPPVVPSFLLTPAVRKAEQPRPDNRVPLPPKLGPIDLKLPVERSSYAAYQVKLHNLATGETSLLGGAVLVEESGAPQVRVRLDSAALRPGRYTIVLQAAEPGGGITEVAGFSVTFSESRPLPGR
jgi:hypothetical protein